MTWSFQADSPLNLIPREWDKKRQGQQWPCLRFGTVRKQEPRRRSVKFGGKRPSSDQD